MYLKIPHHLKKYIIEQNYNQYTYIDQACWRFIMKISVDFFKKYADQVYTEGLQKTGITLNKIPRIKSIDKKLSTFGWRAVCVRGFIPPTAFMEFQSLKILPIAADMRNHRNLTYTPAPDIVHEAAGHAPIIANKDYAKYLVNYGEIAVKSILSSEDMDIYYTIRELSDLKEGSKIDTKNISRCEKNLEKLSKNISYISESSLLSRMNWWTVEYGLIGTIKNSRIYGAGLLSSIGESENCINKKIKKIPFNLDCINYDYNITEQQPQLFITPNYNFLTKELKKISKQMAYKVGGEYGVKQAIKAKTVCTVEIDEIIQISGILSEYMINQKNDFNFIKLLGPSQICYKNKEISSHGGNYHSSGYSTPLGKLKTYNKAIHQLNKQNMDELNLIKNGLVTLDFQGDITLTGKVKNILKRNSRIILVTFTNCEVKKDKLILFEPNWGNFDLISGSKITSVFGGPCDSVNYYKKIENKKSRYKKYNIKNIISNEDKILNKYFKLISEVKKNELDKLSRIYTDIEKKGINDWLLKYEFLVKTNCNKDLPWIKNIYVDLKKLSLKNSDISRAIKRSLNLFS